MHLLSFFLLALTVTKSSHLQLSNCGAGSRRPEFTDISVECGTASISLAILICPVIYTGYNESLLILNHQSDPACRGTLDESVTPPVVRFNFPLNMTNSCGSVFRTTSAAGTGIFSDFSNIQTMNISGVVRSHDPTMGMVTYNAELKYFYSCAYPLEYLINNTQVDVSASSIAVQDINGSFISSLSLDLFSDKNYNKPLVIPSLGIELRTNVYAQVQATNLTSQYHVLLDRCYASISASPTSATYFNLFVPCSMDPMTTILENGESHHACFFFPAFSFLEQQNQTISTYYLHCSTRLCEKSTCNTFKQCNNRKRRGVKAPQSTMEGVTDTHTISSSRIIIRTDSLPSKEEALSGSGESDSYVGLGVAAGVLAITCAIVIVMGTVFYRRLKHN